MIFHVSSCLLAHGEKSLIPNTFRHTKWEYSFSVRPICCTPAFLLLQKLDGFALFCNRDNANEICKDRYNVKGK